MGKNGKTPKFSVKSMVGLLFGILVIVLEILKNITKSGKSPPGGGGSAKNIKKSKIQNLDFMIRGGGGHIFTFFPNENANLMYFS